MNKNTHLRINKQAQNNKLATFINCVNSRKQERTKKIKLPCPVQTQQTKFYTHFDSYCYDLYITTQRSDKDKLFG